MLLTKEGGKYFMSFCNIASIIHSYWTPKYQAAYQHKFYKTILETLYNMHLIGECPLKSPKT